MKVSGLFPSRRISDDSKVSISQPISVQAGTAHLWIPEG